jgi:hypothetical protein
VFSRSQERSQERRRVLGERPRDLGERFGVLENTKNTNQFSLSREARKTHNIHNNQNGDKKRDVPSFLPSF